MGIWKFIVRRAAYHWQLFIALILGVVLGSALLTSGPLIVDTVINFSIPYKINSSNPEDVNLRITTYESFSKESYKRYDQNIRAQINTYLSGYLSKIISNGVSVYAHPWINDDLLEDHGVRLSFYEGLKENTELIAGEWPDNSINGNNELRVVIGESISADYNLTVGDILSLSTSQNESDPSLSYVISGIIGPHDIQDDYWYGDFNPLLRQSDDRWSAQYSVFVDENDFLEVNQRLFAASRPALHWIILIDPKKIKADQVPIFIDHLNELRYDLKNWVPKVNIATNIDNILIALLSRSTTLNIILYLMLVEVLFLAVYYIIMTSTLFVDYVRGEFSNLSSRGSSFRDLLLLETIEIFLVGGFGFFTGIFLALVMVWALAEFGPIADVKNLGWEIRLPTTSWIAAGIGVAVCAISILLPVRNALKGNIVKYSQQITRKEKDPIWQRYRLDVFLLLFGLLLLWRLKLYGGISEAGKNGSVDWLLLLSPLVFLMSAATILYRIFPPIIRGLSALLARGRNFSLTMALLHLARHPTIAARINLLLVMTMALGVLTSGLNATLDASEYERALYAVGSPIRIEFDHRLYGLENADINKDGGGSFVYRSDGSVSTRAYRVIPSYELLAIDPFSLINVTKYRSDYASRPMGEVLGELVVDIHEYEYPAVSIPGKPDAVGLWIYDDTLSEKGDQLIKSLVIRGKFQTSTGEVFISQFRLKQNLDKEADKISQDELGSENTWYYFEGSLPALNEGSYPISIHSFWFNIHSIDFRYWQISILLDDITFKYRDSDQTILDDFETLNNIWQVNDLQARVNFTRQKASHSGTGSLNLILPPGQTSILGVGVFPAGKLARSSIPVLASEEFLRLTELEIGDHFLGDVNSLRVPMYIADGIRYFPTLYDQPGRGFLISPIEPLLIYLNQGIVKPVNANELWAVSDAEEFPISNDYDALGAAKIKTLEETRKSIKADPLSLGLRSVTSISYLISIVLSLVGFCSYFYINAKSREIQFGILCSMGMSKRQLYTILFIEQLIIIVSGLTIGLLLGVLINLIILPGLPLSLSDTSPIPPFLPHIDWASIFTLYGMMLLGFIAVLGLAAIILWKLKIHEVLRIGME